MFQLQNSFVAKPLTTKQPLENLYGSIVSLSLLEFYSYSTYDYPENLYSDQQIYITTGQLTTCKATESL